MRNNLTAMAAEAGNIHYCGESIIDFTRDELLGVAVALYRDGQRTIKMHEEERKLFDDIDKARGRFR